MTSLVLDDSGDTLFICPASFLLVRCVCVFYSIHLCSSFPSLTTKEKKTVKILF